MGWLILLAMIAAAAALLRLSGLRGPFMTTALAALALGAAGYALEGRPNYPGMSAAQQARPKPLSLVDARHAFFGDFASGESWMRISEALAASGDQRQAIEILTTSVKRSPGDAQLWIGLGNALFEQGGKLTPPAEFAYRRAAQVQPEGPAAPFFYGLALARSGNPQAAVAIWQDILAKAPKNASWRPLIEQGVAAISSTTTSAPKPQAGS